MQTSRIRKLLTIHNPPMVLETFQVVVVTLVVLDVDVDVDVVVMVVVMVMVVIARVTAVVLVVEMLEIVRQLTVLETSILRYK